MPIFWCERNSSACQDETQPKDADKAEKFLLSANEAEIKKEKNASWIWKSQWPIIYLEKLHVVQKLLYYSTAHL